MGKSIFGAIVKTMNQNNILILITTSNKIIIQDENIKNDSIINILFTKDIKQYHDLAKMSTIIFGATDQNRTDV